MKKIYNLQLHIKAPLQLRWMPAITYLGQAAKINMLALISLLQFYQGGLLNIPNCSSYKVTQALLVIGYGQYRGRDYWLVKNRYA